MTRYELIADWVGQRTASRRSGRRAGEMIVGFTGTREGCTDAQLATATERFAGLDAVEFHHGCCVGADEEIGVQVYELHPLVSVVGHPSDLKAMTSNRALAFCHHIHEPKPPLARNRDIVDACSVLLAAPRGPEELRSGTWAAVRYARKAGRRILIVWPDGSITTDG